MAGITYTQADLDAITAALATGATSVKYADKEVNYRTLKDLQQLQSDIYNFLNGKTRQSRRYGVYYKNRDCSHD